VPAGTGWARKAGHSGRPPRTATPPPNPQGPSPPTRPSRRQLQNTQHGAGPQPAHRCRLAEAAARRAPHGPLRPQVGPPTRTTPTAPLSGIRQRRAPTVVRRRRRGVSLQRTRWPSPPHDRPAAAVASAQTSATEAAAAGPKGTRRRGRLACPGGRPLRVPPPTRRWSAAGWLLQAARRETRRTPPRGRPPSASHDTRCRTLRHQKTVADSDRPPPPMQRRSAAGRTWWNGLCCCPPNAATHARTRPESPRPATPTGAPADPPTIPHRPRIGRPTQRPLRRR